MGRFMEILFLIMLIALLFIVSCQYAPKIPDSPEILPTPVQKMYEVVSKTDWWATVCIIGITASVFAILNGVKWGFAAAASCFAGLVMSIATARYAHVMAVFGLIGSTLLSVASVFKNKQVVSELVTGIQRIRRAATDDIKDRVDVELSDTQSKVTKKVVQEVKVDLKLKGKIK